MLLVVLLLACGAPETADPSVGGGSTTPTTAPASDAPFTVVVIPDTQYYTLSNPGVLDEIVTWILEHREEHNIAFVLQEGDVTHNNTEVEWQNADAAFGRLDGVVPYTVCVGNHDIGDDGDTSRFNSWFGADRFAGMATFGGSRREAKNDDHFHTFAAGGTEWLVVSLSYDPEGAQLAWANRVFADHPAHRGIVLTHAYLLPDGNLGPEGEALWDEVVQWAPGLTFVLNGHYIAGTEARRVSTGDAGNPVYELFVNYQDLPLGGMGQVRLLHLDPAAGRFDVQTCSAWDVCLDDEATAYGYDGVDLGPVVP
ncbi:MAG: hypothetical protein ACI9K2_006616 [Myxococcota bacterium]|jgi:hypothetical protein